MAKIVHMRAQKPTTATTLSREQILAITSDITRTRKGKIIKSNCRHHKSQYIEEFAIKQTGIREKKRSIRSALSFFY